MNRKTKYIFIFKPSPNLSSRPWTPLWVNLCRVFPARLIGTNWIASFRCLHWLEWGREYVDLCESAWILLGLGNLSCMQQNYKVIFDEEFQKDARWLVISMTNRSHKIYKLSDFVTTISMLKFQAYEKCSYTKIHYIWFQWIKFNVFRHNNRPLSSLRPFVGSSHKCMCDKNYT